MSLHRGSEPMSYPVQVTLSWLSALTIAVLVILAAECQPTPAHAGEWTVTAGLGATHFLPTAVDGVWHQEAFGNGYTLDHFAFKFGAAYHVTPTFELGAGFVNFGTVTAENQVVDDANYDPHRHVCTQNCQFVHHEKVTDSMKAVELTGTYTIPFDHWRIRLTGGGALMFHRLTQVNLEGSGGPAQQLYGRIPAIVLGVGACHWKVCLESTFYSGIGGPDCLSRCGYPISTQLVTNMLTATF